MYTEDKLREKCAVFGSFGASSEASRLAYYSLWTLQHRGQESSGIATSDGKHVYDFSDFGLVANVYKEEDLAGLPGHISIGHNRYSTSGGRDSIYNQPFLNRNRTFAFAHNGNLPLTDKLETFLNKSEVNIIGLNDSGMMTAAIDVHIKQGASLPEAIKQSYPLFQGVFSAVAMDKSCVVAFRDKCGIRPLSIGKLNGGYVILSETCAFETIGAEAVRDVRPGEMVVVDKDGLHSYQLAKPNQKLDIFEFVYFARPDSVLLGKSVNEVRGNLGHQLAKEYSLKGDVVIPVPDSSIPAALGYSKSSGIPLELGLVKNRYINRTFIRPTDALRKRDLMLKLNPVTKTLKNRDIILVDDSVVRGTTLKQVVAMLKEAGARKIHLMISSPPVMYPDFYGINTPSQDDLIAAKMNNEQICRYMGADSINYLSLKGMIKATGLPKSIFCTSAFTGEYPIPIGKKVEGINYINARPVKKPIVYKKISRTKSVGALV
ncbi:MAG TPA: amidophosphoribosyltransferase [Candidatus Saccharimonadales bacterium]|nr:amidophosphoribosyltransferase [Candidatus Saccharimonadales bacterium]